MSILLGIIRELLKKQKAWYDVTRRVIIEEKMRY